LSVLNILGEKCKLAVLGGSLSMGGHANVER